MQKSERIITYYLNVVLSVCLFLLIVVFPYYAPDGYVKLGANKFYFFRMVGLECLMLMLPAAVLLALLRKGNRRNPLSGTDWAMILYVTAVIVSYACTQWKDRALWGTEGWSMGLMTQVMFVAVYFCVSRFSEKTAVWYALFLAASLGVFLIGILNRFSVDLLWSETDTPAFFISTLGNINWFCGYWSVVFPIGLVWYWSGEGNRFWKRAGLMLYAAAGFMVGVIQGSSSGFLVLGAVFLLLFLLSFQNGDRFLRWMELVMLFAMAALLTGIIKRIFPTALNYKNEIEEYVTQCTVSGFLLGGATACYGMVRYLFKKKPEYMGKLFMALYGVAAGMAFVAGLMIVAGLAGAGALQFDDHWGNGRGAAWRTGVQAFADMPFLNKLVGIGPDCFGSYVYGRQDMAEGLYAVFGNSRLENAHNELLTMLVNTGVCGALSYAAVFLAAMYCQFRAGRQKGLLLIPAVCIFSYCIHNMVSFQQVVSTPVVFMLIGFGERELRKGRS